MSDATSTPPPPPAPVVPPAPPTAPAQVITPLQILKAITDPVRYRILQEMAGGAEFSIVAMARKLGAQTDMMGRHFQTLRRARLLRRVKPEGADGRLKHFHIPAEFRPAQPDGRKVVDFGSCVLRF